MSEQKLSEHNPPSEGRSIEYWRVRWQLVHDSMPSHLKVPKVVLDSGDGLVTALEAKLEAMKNAAIIVIVALANYETSDDRLDDVREMLELALAAAQEEKE